MLKSAARLVDALKPEKQFVEIMHGWRFQAASIPFRAGWNATRPSSPAICLEYLIKLKEHGRTQRVERTAQIETMTPRCICLFQDCLTCIICQASKLGYSRRLDFTCPIQTLDVGTL